MKSNKTKITFTSCITFVRTECVGHSFSYFFSLAQYSVTMQIYGILSFLFLSRSVSNVSQNSKKKIELNQKLCRFNRFSSLLLCVRVCFFLFVPH